ncbi:MAG TPA: S9 family peptidase, partial [Myxococcaceae bacterium]
MRTLPLSSFVAVLLTASVSVAADDPFLWLEEVQGPRALEWVSAQNAKTLAVLEKDPRFEPFRTQALEILTATDRIPRPIFRAGGVDNFWQDRANPRGLWRHTSLESYLSPSPEWQTVLDIDALTKTEGANWFFKGMHCLAPEDRLCLVRLSNGGKDATEVREFDAVSKTFIQGGFRLPEGKQAAEWLDQDTLLVGRDWGQDTLTESGYPFVLKRWKRGEPLEKAVEVFRGKKTDVRVGTMDLRDAEGRLQAMVIERGVTFFESEFYLLTEKEPVRLPLPPKASIRALA